MRKLLVLILLLGVQPLSAQKDSTDIHPRNVIFLEGGGNAMVYSVNFGRVLWGKRMSAFMFRVGFEYLPFEEGPELQFPFEWSLLIGKKKHFLEVGVGFTIFSRVVYPHISPGGIYMGLQSQPTRIGGANACGRIGYCFMPLYKKNVMFRIALTPMYYDRYNYYHHSGNGKEIYFWRGISIWGGVSIGYAF